MSQQQNRQQGPNITEIGKKFVEYYYKIFDSDRKQLANLFKDESYMSFENQGFQGRDKIMNHLCNGGIKFKKISHAPKTLDVQPSGNNGLLVFVTGQVKVDDETNAILFSEIFHLIPTDPKLSSWWVHNNIFRLNYS